MSRHENINELVKTGRIRAAPLKRTYSRTELFRIAHQAYDNPAVPANLRPPHFIEFTPSLLLRFRSTSGTVLAPMVRALQEAGVKVRPNLGSVKRVLGLSHRELHQMACYCGLETISRSHMQLGIVVASGLSSAEIR